MRPDPPIHLIHQAKKKDPDAFGLLVSQTRRDALHIAFRIVGNHEDASDVLQEAYARLWNSFHRYNPNRPFNAWFGKIIRNLAIDCLRRRKHVKMTLNDDSEDPQAENPASHLENSQLIDIIRKWIPSLPRTQQTVFILRDIENLSVSEVQAESGLTEGSVKTNLHLARKKLRKHLSHYGYQ